MLSVVVLQVIFNCCFFRLNSFVLMTIIMKFRGKLGMVILGLCVLICIKMLFWHKEISSLYLRDSELEKRLELQLEKGLELQVIRKSLNYTNKQFFLNQKPITIISGAVHYFRFPQEYWEDRLMKMKACGLNTIDVYVPWNLHEPIPGKFDFDGDINLVKFLLLAKKLDLLVILRPGPYICSEWEFGGLPSWLLRDETMKVRTMHPNYIKAVENYFNKLLPLIRPLQYKYGGPIIAFQLDNEYGSYFKDESYLPYLKKLMETSDINELFLISDSIAGLEKQTLPGVLKTVNFKHVDTNLLNLEKMQSNAPLMVMEFWTGWFDWWGFEHHTLPVHEFGETLNQILSTKASVSMYMFYGGTNFGFMNGGFQNEGSYKSDITSYDYDAPLAENGDITLKYHKAKSIIEQHFPDYVPAREKNEFLEKGNRKAYNSIKIVEFVSIWDVLHLLPVLNLETPLAMEMLNINEGAGQSYGYTLYRTEVEVTDKSAVIAGFKNVFDRGILFIDDNRAAYITDENKHRSLNVEVKNNPTKVDLLIENGGRINWELFDDQRKGLLGPILWNSIPIKNWNVYPIEMKKSFIMNLKALKFWSNVSTLKDSRLKSPSFFKVSLDINAEPQDTYIDMSGWGKGVAFVNDRNLGRYWSIGPQRALYLPAPWLHKGKNSIVIFEENQFAMQVEFSAEPKLN